MDDKAVRGLSRVLDPFAYCFPKPFHGLARLKLSYCDP